MSVQIIFWDIRWRRSWCNAYRRRKWSWRLEFNTYTRLFAFPMALISLGKLWVTLFFLELWVNSGLDIGITNGFIIIIIIIIMSCRQYGYPWPSLATSPCHSSPPAGLQDYILCPYIVAVCKFVLVVLLLHIHMWGSTEVHRFGLEEWKL